MHQNRARAGLVAAALTGLAVLGVQAPASAAPADCPAGQRYAPGVGCVDGNLVIVNGDKTLTAGELIDLVISGLQPFSTLKLYLHSDPIFLGEFTADGNGVVQAQVRVPDGLAAGTHHIEAVGTGANGQPVTYSLAVVVAGAAGGSSTPAVSPVTSGSALPRTGTEVDVLALTGLLLVGAGAATVVATRRRPVSV